MNQRARLLNSLFKLHSTPKPRTATTTAPGRALPSSTFSCTNWWRTGQPSLSCDCTSQPIYLHQGLSCKQVAAAGSSPAPLPGSSSDLGRWHGSTGAVWFIGIRILPGVLRDSALPQEQATRQTLVMVLSPARHRTAAGSIRSTAPDRAAHGVSTFFCLLLSPTLPLRLGKRCSKHTLQFAWNFSTAQAKISL